MRILNTVYVDGHGSRVGLRRGSIYVERRDGTKTKVPFQAVDGIVLTARVQASGELLAECARRKVRLAALNRAGMLRYVVGGPVSGNVHLRVAQHGAHADEAHVLSLSRSFVAGKLQNCRRMLTRWEWDSEPRIRRPLAQLRQVVEERIGALSGAEDGDRIRGIEGDGTRRYFRGLALHLGGLRTGLYFSGRSRRPPRDPVNALMSYTYGLVTAEIVGSLEAVGLDPQIGYLHGVRSGRPALALDLLEELRPAVADRFVMRLIGRRRVSLDSFVVTGGGACYLSDDARPVVLDAYEEFKSEEVRHILLDRSLPRSSIPITQATLLARHLRGDLPSYPPYVIAA
jgi:CRISP-associated protein Cas1